MLIPELLHTLQVPPNNNPVQDEAPDLLNLENELESMERVKQVLLEIL